MNSNEMKELYALALEGVSIKIERKCELISETCASYSNVREKWNAIPYDDED